jgi:vacuolar protein sorting-associated protein 13B
MSIENSTDFSIYVAQCENSQSSGNNEPSASNSLTKTVHLIHEISDEILVWHQVIPARGVIYYTPPTLDEVFPEIQSTLDFGLAFACFSGECWPKLA